MGLYLKCIGTYNSCRGGFAPIPARPIPGGTVFNLLDSALPDRAHAAFNRKSLGLTSLGAVLGYSGKVGNKITGVPDLFKSFMFKSLAHIAGKAQGQWAQGASTFEENADKYQAMADRIREALVASAKTCEDGNDKDCEKLCAKNPTDSQCQKWCERNPQNPPM